METTSQLREFQAYLLKRMAAASDEADIRDRRLSFMVGHHRYLVDLREISEIVFLMPITRVPLTHDWYLGIANIRGHLFSIIDLERFQSGCVQETSKESRVIILSPLLAVASGLLVSRILGLCYIRDMCLQKDQDISMIVGATQAYIDQQGQVWIEMSLAALVQDERFVRVGV